MLGFHHEGIRHGRLKTCPASGLLHAAIGLLCLGTLPLAGCGSAESVTGGAAPPMVEPASASAPAAPGDRDLWEVNYIQGTRVGYTHTSIRHVTEDGHQLVRIESLVRISTKRFNETTQTEIRCSSLETPEGRLIQCSSTISPGASPVTCEGRVAGDKLQWKITTTGKTMTAAIPWSSDCGGFFALELGLQRQADAAGRTADRPGTRAGYERPGNQ